MIQGTDPDAVFDPDILPNKELRIASGLQKWVIDTTHSVDEKATSIPLCGAVVYSATLNGEPLTKNL